MKRGESQIDLVLLWNSNNPVRKEELIFLVCFLITVKQWKEKSLGVGLQDFVMFWQEICWFLICEFSRCALTSVNKYYFVTRMMDNKDVPWTLNKDVSWILICLQLWYLYHF